MKKGIRNRILKSTLFIILIVNIISLSIVSSLIIYKIKEDSIKDIIVISDNLKYILRNSLIKSEDIYEKINDIYYLGFDYVGIYKDDINNKQSIGSILELEDIKAIYTESNNISSIVKTKYINKDLIITYNYPIYGEDFIANIIVQKSFINDLNNGIDN